MPPTRNTTDTVNRNAVNVRIQALPPDGSSTLLQRAHIEVGVAFIRDPAPPGTDGSFLSTRTLKIADAGDGPTRVADGDPAPSLTDAGPANAFSAAERTQLFNLLAKAVFLAEELDGFTG